MSTLVILLSIGYFAIFSIISIGLIFSNNHQSNSFSPKNISIIIVAKDEENSLPELLETLLEQNYPEKFYEVILVDDDSSDSTGQIMENYADSEDNWRKLKHEKSSDSPAGKKGALSFAIPQAEGEIIMTTDADCQVPENWIKSMSQYFSKEVGMVLGYSPVKLKKGLFNFYQRCDSLCEGALAAATSYFNKPTHSNARNLAFKKDAFFESGEYKGYTDIDTGDDFYLSKNIINRTNYKFKYNTDPDSYVTTDEIGFGKKYLHQQLRRNSKSMDLIPIHKLGGIVVLSFHISLLTTLLFPELRHLFWPGLGIKFLSETIPFTLASRKFKEQDLLFFYPIFWILYPILFLSFQILGSLKIYTWK